MKQIIYDPKKIEFPYIPEEIIKKESAWHDNENILLDVLENFNVKRNIALDMGVLFGYSTCALANYFQNVIGIDTFREDRYENSLDRPSNYEEVKNLVSEFKNIELIETLWQDYAEKNPEAKFDLIHLDMIHSYEETLNAGRWAANHSNFLIFHDTIGYPEVIRALEQLSDETNMIFYNHVRFFGLGILIREE